MRIPFGTVSITEKSKKLVQEALESGRVSSGKFVRQLEKRFAELVGSKEAVAVSSGGEADTLALAVLYDFGAQRGDEVIVPALSFVATGNSVLQAGFKPVFVDVERSTLNIDVGKIEKAITARTRAIMPVHLMGKPADMDPINGMAKRHDLFVVEDAAEAHGSTYKGKVAGAIGDMGAFSLYVAHMVTSVEGGMVVTDNPRFAEILRSLRSHGRACDCEVCVLNTSSAYCSKRFKNEGNFDIRFHFERIGYSSKMNELEAAIGLGSMDLYSDILTKRRKNYSYLIKNFKRFSPHIVTIEPEAHEEVGPHAFPFVIQENAGFRREDLADFLEKKGIDTRNLFQSMPTQCPGFKFLGYKLGDFPEAEFVGRNGLHIGIHQDLDRQHLDYFLNAIEEFLGQSRNCIEVRHK